MSDYCTACAYHRQKPYGESACPFNCLFWDFFKRHQAKLQNNPRIGMIYRSWDRMDADKRDAILSTAEARLANIEHL